MRKPTSIQARILNIPFYPFLIGLYAVLFLWSVNVGQVFAPVTVRSLGVVLALCGLVTFTSLLLIRSRHKAALASGWVLVVLLMYGQFFNLLDGRSVGGLAVGRHRFFLPLIAVASVAILAAILTSRKNLQTLTRVINLVLLALIVFSILPIVSYEIRYGSQLYQSKSKSLAVVKTPDPTAPDVYYIILDGYTRSDVLASDFDYDNQSFIDSLKKMGFYIPGCPFSNYITTTPSLSSSMNMDYLENMGVTEKAITDSFDPMLSSFMIQSKVRQEFESIGYKIAAFRGYLPALDLRDADYYFNNEEKERHIDLVMMHTFERMMMRTSILRPVVEAYETNENSLAFLPTWVLKAMDMQPDMYTVTDRQQQAEMEYTFNVLPTLPGLPGKKLVYAHILATHIPYLFNENGETLPKEMHYSKDGYVQTIAYTNKRMLDILQALMEKSAVKPVILLQADHGMPDETGVQHNKILNAYYFPDGDYSRLYDTITPVNTFRVVFNQFFQHSYPLLPDTLLIKSEPQPGQPVTRKIPSSCTAK